MTPPELPPHSSLTEAEVAVLRQVAKGLDNRVIAATLGCSEHTVGNHLRVIFQKIHVTSRTQAALYALRHGLALLDPPS